MDDAVMLTEVIERLEAARAEIAIRYEQKVHDAVSAYRALPLAPNGAHLVDLIARFLRGRAAGAPVDFAAIGELDALSADRAGRGIGVGDLFAGVILFLSCAREAVFERTADSDLRAMGGAWAEVEKSAAVIAAFLFDQHAGRVK